MKTVISIFYGIHLVPHFLDNSVCVCVCVCVCVSLTELWTKWTILFSPIGDCPFHRGLLAELCDFSADGTQQCPLGKWPVCAHLLLAKGGWCGGESRGEVACRSQRAETTPFWTFYFQSLVCSRWMGVTRLTDQPHLRKTLSVGKNWQRIGGPLRSLRGARGPQPWEFHSAEPLSTSLHFPLVLHIQEA